MASVWRVLRVKAASGRGHERHIAHSPSRDWHEPQALEHVCPLRAVVVVMLLLLEARKRLARGRRALVEPLSPIPCCPLLSRRALVEPLCQVGRGGAGTRCSAGEGSVLERPIEVIAGREREGGEELFIMASWRL